MDQKELKQIRDLKILPDSDNIRFKNVIVNALWQDPRIIHFLNSTELSEDCPDEYVNTHIRKYLMIPEVQTVPENYICITSHFTEAPRYNKIEKYAQISFVIMCDCRTVNDKETGIPRHDLLGALILDIFNWTNILGIQIHCVSDKESTTDTDYATRTIIFESIIPNNIVKTYNGETRVINKELQHG